MIKSFREIDNNLTNEVCNCFEKNFDFNSLRENYPFLDYNVLYSILYSTGKYSENIYNYLYQVNIDDSKILIISDTHYGSMYENFNYTYDVFHFATANGIRVILHGGDIIEANIKQRRGCGIIKQADYFISRYPFDNNINTYAILGNHDYLAINKNQRIRDILNSRNDINMLGFKKVYLKWCGHIISLQHDIENFKLNLPINAEYLSFKGHSHFYHIKEKKKGKNERIYIPPMCSDPVYYVSNPQVQDRMVKPGFLTAEVDETDIIVTNYSFAHGEIVKQNEFKKILKRK
ncbi:MAG: metallophosphoesterase [Bacilli bacterium]|nr:metallophosphoesterase [Bacilli bacterium]